MKFNILSIQPLKFSKSDQWIKSYDSCQPAVKTANNSCQQGSIILLPPPPSGGENKSNFRKQGREIRPLQMKKIKSRGKEEKRGGKKKKSEEKVKNK